MSNYLAVCDLDDTLLTSKKTITFKTKWLIRKWCKKGNYFCINTGRPFPGCIQYYNRLGLKMPLITDNGCFIYFPSEKGFTSKEFTLDKDIFLKFYNEAKDYLEGIFSQQKHKMITNNVKIFPSWLIHDEEGNELVEGNIEDILDEDLAIINTKVKLDKKEDFEKVLEKYKDVISFRYWGSYDDLHSFELYSSKASKGKALLYLEKELGIDHDHTLAFGDQKNDASMITDAYYGVVMINGVEDLKKLSEYQTEYDMNHNGVAKYLIKNAK